MIYPHNGMMYRSKMKLYKYIYMYYEKKEMDYQILFLV